MTADGRLLKISCIVGLFVGLATLVTGIVLAVGNLADIDAWVTAGEGLLSAVFGVRSAILANVPSNTSTIRKKALIFLLGAAAAMGYVFTRGQEAQVVQLCLAGVICAIALAALFVSQRIVKEQLRK